eukprot:3088896-Pyramimonas_sp.AAC.2
MVTAVFQTSRSLTFRGNPMVHTPLVKAPSGNRLTNPPASQLSLVTFWFKPPAPGLRVVTVWSRPPGSQRLLVAPWSRPPAPGLRAVTIWPQTRA